MRALLGERLSCELEGGARALYLPPELIERWPTGPDSLRQVSLRAQLKERRLQGADRGGLTEGVSLLVRLPE